MGECELFERQFRSWKAGELTGDDLSRMSRHAADCSFCAKHNDGIIRVRDMVVSQRMFRPKDGFEFRLQQNISNSARRKPAKVVFTRWTALGAGLATGFAVGAFILFSPASNGPQSIAPAQLAAIPSPAVEQVNDSLITRSDTVKTVETNPYNAGRHSRVVSETR